MCMGICACLRHKEQETITPFSQRLKKHLLVSLSLSPFVTSPFWFCSVFFPFSFLLSLYFLIMSIAQCMPSELIVHILKYLTHPTDLSSSALTCKSWSLHALELLWYKPNFVQASAWVTFCNVLSETRPTLFPYTHYIRRINLSLLASDVKDSHLTALSVCERLERVTLTNCSNLTDNGIMDFLGTKSRKHLVSVDLSDVTSVTDASIKRIAETCPHLQGLNLSMCKEGMEPFVGVTDSSVIMLAERCTGLRRVSGMDDDDG